MGESLLGRGGVPASVRAERCGNLAKTLSGTVGSDDPRAGAGPYDEPLVGPAAIAESWLGDRDEPGSWEASYAPALIEGDTAIAKGETRYTDGNVFSNLFELDFDADGRCTRFVEWYLLHRNGNGAG